MFIFIWFQQELNNFMLYISNFFFKLRQRGIMTDYVLQQITAVLVKILFKSILSIITKTLEKNYLKYKNKYFLRTYFKCKHKILV